MEKPEGVGYIQLGLGIFILIFTSFLFILPNKPLTLNSNKSIMNRFCLFFSRYHWENWIFVPIISFFVLTLLVSIFHPFSPSNYLQIFNPHEGDNTAPSYLLSALIQTLGALLALSIPLTIVATQLAAQIYTPLIANFQYKSYDLWSIVICYIAEIAYCGFLLLEKQLQISNPLYVDIALIFGIFCILLLIPFFIRTFKLLMAKYLFQYLALRIKPEHFTEPVFFTKTGAGEENIHLLAYYEILEKLIQDGRFKSAITGIKILEDIIISKLRKEWTTAGGERLRIICDNLSKNIWYLGRTACLKGQIEVLVRLMAMCSRTISYLIDSIGGEHAMKFYDTMLQLNKDADTFFKDRAEVFRDYFIALETMKKDAAEMLAGRFLKITRWDGVIEDRRQQLKQRTKELQEELFPNGKEKNE